MIPQPYLKMELFCSSMYTQPTLGHDAFITLTSLPLKQSHGSSPTCLHFLPFPEGKVHRAILPTEWNAEFTLCCLWSWFRKTAAGSGRKGGLPLSKDGRSKWNKAFPHAHPSLAKSEVYFPQLLGSCGKGTPHSPQGSLGLVLRLTVEIYTVDIFKTTNDNKQYWQP